MKYGLSDSEYSFLVEHLITPLKERGAQVFLFGSRATGKYKKFSDIDILYKNPTVAIPNSEIYRLLIHLEESTFPYKIDLVCDNELAASYRDSVEISKIEL
ncbi:nucleotidyltransferase family protein [Bdellovibrio bacteriovorus]|uniref:nucleotidyltransferase family protein n=1 Tax=Bdellovibrio TaxID=958 RepID=UPI0035A996CE